MAGQTIEQLFKYVEEKIVGLEMLLKHGLGYSKSFDRQLRIPVDFYVLDYMIYEHKTTDALNHISYLEKRYLKLYMDNASIRKLAKTDPEELYFSSEVKVAQEIKNELKEIANRLKLYKNILNGRSEDTSSNGKFLASVVDYLLAIEIDGVSIFEYDTNEERNFVKSNLQKFLSKEFKKIKPNLNFTTISKRERYAYYIIRYLAKKNSIGFSEINNITINGSDFTPNKMYQHNSKLEHQINKNILPEHFRDFIESFKDGISMHIEE